MEYMSGAIIFFGHPNHQNSRLNSALATAIYALNVFYLQNLQAKFHVYYKCKYIEEQLLLLVIKKLRCNFRAKLASILMKPTNANFLVNKLMKDEF